MVKSHKKEVYIIVLFLLVFAHTVHNSLGTQQGAIQSALGEISL